DRRNGVPDENAVVAFVGHDELCSIDLNSFPSTQGLGSRRGQSLVGTVGTKIDLSEYHLCVLLGGNWNGVPDQNAVVVFIGDDEFGSADENPRRPIQGIDADACGVIGKSDLPQGNVGRDVVGVRYGVPDEHPVVSVVSDGEIGSVAMNP